MTDAYTVTASFPFQVITWRRAYQPPIRRRGRANLRAMRRDWLRRFDALNRIVP